VILPIDSREKQMLDLVDGQRTIAAIAGASGGDVASPLARRFFERLFWYDQIVLASPTS
jgi:hypothetical protein